MVLLFIACAIVPVSALAAFSYRQVSRQLEAQSRASLREAGKLAGMALLERLDFLDAEFRAVASRVASWNSVAAQWDPTGLESAGLLIDHLQFVFLRDGDRTLPIRMEEEASSVPSGDLPGRADGHLEEGHSLLHVVREGPDPRVFLVRRLETGRAERTQLWAEVDADYLFTAGLGENSVPAEMNLCILDGGIRPLYCPRLPGEDQLKALASAMNSRDTEAIGWEGSEEEYLTGFWTAFLGYTYGVRDWTLMLSEPRAAALSAMGDFRRVFPPIVALVVVLAFLFSNIQIRHNLEPLDRLKAATERIARRDFGTPVEVRSGDEFQDLARAVNAMGRSLGEQFSAMAALGEIDRAVLSALQTDAVVDIVLARASDVTPCDAVAIGIIKDDGELRLSGSVGDRRSQGPFVHRPDDEELDLLERGALERFGPEREWPGYLRRVLGDTPNAEHLLVFPLRTSDALLGVLALGYEFAPDDAGDALTWDRKLADQVAMALDSAALIERMDRLTQGTLEALARTVDSKSHWTAGHSERVAEVAVRLARAMEFSDLDLEVLHRGALLHDIGKIGVPATILNKPERLTDEEMAKVKEHAEIGFRILSPVESLADILPIVRHHHERMDGKGYPQGIPATELPDLVRLVTVVDTYDTLVHDRPYRKGWDTKTAIEILRDSSGTQFDPRFVEGLVSLIGREQAQAPTSDAASDSVPSAEAIEISVTA
jgi:putative nucleotidyltransferase with HDIG domain